MAIIKRCARVCTNHPNGRHCSSPEVQKLLNWLTLQLDQSVSIKTSSFLLHMFKCKWNLKQNVLTFTRSPANTTNFHFQPTFALPAAVSAITFSPQPESFMHALNDEQIATDGRITIDSSRQLCRHILAHNHSCSNVSTAVEVAI